MSNTNLTDVVPKLIPEANTSYWSKSGIVFYKTAIQVLPTSISGLKLWLDASQETYNDNDSVTTWHDKSGNGYDYTQSTNIPVFKTNIVNGLPVVRFNGTSNYMDGSATTFVNATTSYTNVFMVEKVPQSANYGMIRFKTTSNEIFLAHDSTHVGVAKRGVDQLYTTETIFRNDFTIVHFKWSFGSPFTGGVTQNCIANAVSSLGVPGGSSNANCIGKDGGSAGYIEGDIAEMIVYDSVTLTTANVISIMSYLSNKYAINVGG